MTRTGTVPLAKPLASVHPGYRNTPADPAGRRGKQEVAVFPDIGPAILLCIAASSFLTDVKAKYHLLYRYLGKAFPIISTHEGFHRIQDSIFDGILIVSTAITCCVDDLLATTMPDPTSASMSG